MKFALQIETELFKKMLMVAVLQGETVPDFIDIAIRDRLNDIKDIEELYSSMNKKSQPIRLALFI